MKTIKIMMCFALSFFFQASHASCGAQSKQSLKQSTEVGVPAAKKINAIPEGDVIVCKCGQTKLMHAAAHHDGACVTALLDQGANVNLHDKYQNTALHYAVGRLQSDCPAQKTPQRCPCEVSQKYEHETILSTLTLLINRGAHTNWPHSKEKSLLLFIMQTQEDRDKHLTTKEHMIKECTTRKKRPLEFTTIELAISLIKACNVNLDERSSDGATALIKAISRRYIRLVKALINRGADLSITHQNGDSVLTWANNEEIHTRLSHGLYQDWQLVQEIIKLLKKKRSDLAATIHSTHQDNSLYTLPARAKSIVVGYLLPDEPSHQIIPVAQAT